MTVFLRLPLLVSLAALVGLSMMVPAVYASVNDDAAIARHFFYAGLLVLIGAGMVGLAVLSRPTTPRPRDTLAAMLGFYAGMPLIMAVPFAESLPDTGMFNAWWEMTSALTTTGASLYSADLLPMTLHLWRAIAGWLGGLFILIAATAVLAPLHIGGFEIMAEPYRRRPEHDDGMPGASGPVDVGAHLSSSRFQSILTHPNHRLYRSAAAVLPVYAGLTLVLWLVLLLLGDPGVIALCRAMGTLSTSGISPVIGPAGVHSGFAGEVAVLLCLLPALSRRFWPGGSELRASDRLIDDPELKMAGGLVALVALTLFARHFLGAIEATEASAASGMLVDLRNGLAAFWGGLFNALSYLTTTGWTSQDWQGARAWSGLTSPGLILAGLAMMGGGVATTAGGVKLLRVYALARHGQRELERIIHPSSIAGGGSIARRLRREGAYLAFIFFMLFAISIAVVVALVSFQRIEIETATILSIAALTNTGPLATAIPLTPTFEATAGVASAPWEGWSGLPVFTKSVLAGAMIVGRIETLAILALFSPQFWRR